jgi:polysaccharide chain length determinant protein (PEP-CTERM system associated)
VNSTTELDFGRILGVCYRQKHLIVAVFVVVSLLAAYLAISLPDIYRSNTLILVTPQRVPTSYVASTVTIDLRERLQSAIQQTLSRTHLEKTVQEFNLYATSGSTKEERIERLRRMINFHFQRENVFQLSFDSESPETAKKVTSRLASFFIEQNLQVREQQAIGTKSFINAEADRLRKDLELQEINVNRFKAANRFELPDQLDANLRTLEQLRAELQASLLRLNSLHERKGVLEKQLVEAEGAGPEVVTIPGSDKGVLSPREVLVQTRKRELDDLLRRYSPKHPDVLQLKNEIAAAEDEIKSQSIMSSSSLSSPYVAVTSPLVQVLQKQLAGLDPEIKALQSHVENLRRQVAVYQTRVDNTSVRAIELSKISRTYDITLKKYQDLLAKGMESQLSENMEKAQRGEQFQIVDPANFPVKPHRPNRQMIILVGVLAALGGGFGLAFLWNALDSSFSKIDEISTHLNVPLLATIPALVTRGDVLERRRARGLLVLASIGVVALGVICVRIFGPMYL